MRTHRLNPDSDEMRQAEADHARATFAAIMAQRMKIGSIDLATGEWEEDEVETIRRLAELRLFDPEQLPTIARMKTWKDEDCDPTP